MHVIKTHTPPHWVPGECRKCVLVCVFSSGRGSYESGEVKGKHIQRNRLKVCLEGADGVPVSARSDHASSSRISVSPPSSEGSCLPPPHPGILFISSNGLFSWAGNRHIFPGCASRFAESKPSVWPVPRALSQIPALCSLFLSRVFLSRASYESKRQGVPRVRGKAPGCPVPLAGCPSDSRGQDQRLSLGPAESAVPETGCPSPHPFSLRGKSRVFIRPSSVPLHPRRNLNLSCCVGGFLPGKYLSVPICDLLETACPISHPVPSEAPGSS